MRFTVFFSTRKRVSTVQSKPWSGCVFRTELSQIQTVATRLVVAWVSNKTDHQHYE